MKSAKASGTLGLVVLAAFVSPLAVADNSDWYIGANVGQSGAEIDDAKITSSLLGGGFTSTTIDDDDRGTGYKIFGGYQINKNFAIEGGYFDLGEFGFKATTVPTGTLTGDLEVKGLNLDLVGFLPVTEKFSAFARVGVTYAETKDHFTGTGLVTVTNPNPDERATNYKYGLGVQYDFTEALGVRAEVERYRINDAVGNDGDIDLVSLGLVYRFGGSTPAPVAVAAAPVPEPVVVRPPMPTRVSFSADSLFEFDKDIVKPAGKQELDKFAADLSGSDFEIITVTGHTDRIGSHAYNMDLSARRAEAVKSYLVESGGIPAGKITTRGVDGAEPVTKPGDCVGNKRTQELIDCLQPDRRVEVEVSGTKE